MSVDRSLKMRNALTRHRNVLTRAERLEILAEDGHWEEEKDSVYGLTKVAHRKVATAKKEKKAKVEGEEGVEAGAEAEAETKPEGESGGSA